MALIILCAMPVFASTPEQDMVLIVDEADGQLSGLQQVSDEEMKLIEGNFCSNIEDWNFGNFTGAGSSTTDSGASSWQIEKPTSNNSSTNDANNDDYSDCGVSLLKVK